MRVTHATVVEGDVCTVRIAGDVDMSEVEAVAAWLRAAVDTSGCDVVEVDLADTGFLDSMGIAGLVRAHDHARERGVRLRCVNVQPWVLRVFQVAGVADHLDIG
ncbi:STAS domain-containing protein [Catellatospora sichuanensis]|uniref:STAS domain-containing protein n=1 Tax=Catellatospora sichuanensis TaxID=1969805 RepID=UPI0016427C30|nr:STAS domain-containing protein [Catellatospora sichuanensis]